MRVDDRRQIYGDEMKISRRKVTGNHLNLIYEGTREENSQMGKEQESNLSN